MKAKYFLLVFAMMVSLACSKTGKVVEEVKDHTPSPNLGYHTTIDGSIERDMDFAAIGGRPTGIFIVELTDGQKVKCKNSFPDLKINDKVKVKQTDSGDWVILKIVKAD